MRSANASAQQDSLRVDWMAKQEELLREAIPPAVVETLTNKCASRQGEVRYPLTHSLGYGNFEDLNWENRLDEENTVLRGYDPVSDFSDRGTKGVPKAPPDLASLPHPTGPNTGRSLPLPSSP